MADDKPKLSDIEWDAHEPVGEPDYIVIMDEDDVVIEVRAGVKFDTIYVDDDKFLQALRIRSQGHGGDIE